MKSINTDPIDTFIAEGFDHIRVAGGAMAKLILGVPGLASAFRHQIIAEGPVASAENLLF